MDRQLFGTRMKGCRERLGLTQADLAAKTGLQPSAICFFENGTRLPSLENLITVANALGESIDVLVGRSEGIRPTGKQTETLLMRFGIMLDEDRESLVKIAGVFAERAQSPFLAAPQ